jgi:hypothetical protein
MNLMETKFQLTSPEEDSKLNGNVVSSRQIAIQIGFCRMKIKEKR